MRSREIVSSGDVPIIEHDVDIIDDLAARLAEAAVIHVSHAVSAASSSTDRDRAVRSASVRGVGMVPVPDHWLTSYGLTRPLRDVPSGSSVEVAGLGGSPATANAYSVLPCVLVPPCPFFADVDLGDHPYQWIPAGAAPGTRNLIQSQLDVDMPSHVVFRPVGWGRRYAKVEPGIGIQSQTPGGPAPRQGTLGAKLRITDGHGSQLERYLTAGHVVHDGSWLPNVDLVDDAGSALQASVGRGAIPQPWTGVGKVMLSSEVDWATIDLTAYAGTCAQLAHAGPGFAAPGWTVRMRGAVSQTTVGTVDGYFEWINGNVGAWTGCYSVRDTAPGGTGFAAEGDSGAAVVAIQVGTAQYDTVVGVVVGGLPAASTCGSPAALVQDIDDVLTAIGAANNGSATLA